MKGVSIAPLLFSEANDYLNQIEFTKQNRK